MFVRGVGGDAAPGARPIFDLSRTVVGGTVADRSGEAAESAGGVPAAGATAAADGTVIMRRATRVAPTRITFLSTMDFDLPEGAAARLGPGEVFGEIGSMSGWPQSVTARTATECRLLQIKVAALRLMKRKSKELKKHLDQLYRERSLGTQLKNTPLFEGCTDVFIEAVKENVELVSCEPNEEIVRAGEPADAVYLVRSGFVKLLQGYADGEIAVSYLSKGMTLGEVEFVLPDLDGWQSTARSVEYAELVKIPRTVVEQLVQNQPRIGDELWRTATDRVREAGASRRNVAVAEFTEVALRTGLVQGNSILAIDLDSVHALRRLRQGLRRHPRRPAAVRARGQQVRQSPGRQVAATTAGTRCVWSGCPTGAIHRAGVGEVVKVDEEVCIGCSNCAKNCPYDAIVMHDTGSVWPDDMIPTGLRGRDRAVASKCDLCSDTGHGPACVSSCPQGCAFRVGSLEEFRRAARGRRVDGVARASGSPTPSGRESRRAAAVGWSVALALVAVYVAGRLVLGHRLGQQSQSGVRLGGGGAACWRSRRSACASARSGSPAGCAPAALGLWLAVHLYGGSIFLLLVFLHSDFGWPHGWVTTWLLGLSIWTVVERPRRARAAALDSAAPDLGPVERGALRADSGAGGGSRARAPQTLAGRERSRDSRSLRAQDRVRSSQAPTRRWRYFVDITGGAPGAAASGALPARQSSRPKRRRRLDELEGLYRAKLEIDAHFTLQQALRSGSGCICRPRCLLWVFLGTSSVGSPALLAREGSNRELEESSGPARRAATATPNCRWPRRTRAAVAQSNAARWAP